MQVNKLRITAIQRLCVSDGPGVRTVVFLKGCTLNCAWCCNPEAIQYSKDLLFDKFKCDNFYGSKYCDGCIKLGGARPTTDCPFHAYEKTYEEYTPDELFILLMRDKKIYDTGGGVTFSGGEPTLFAKLLLPLLLKLKNENIHIAFETTLFVKNENIEIINSLVDYWLIDLKFQYGYFESIQISRSDFEHNLKIIQKSSHSENIEYRIVVMGKTLPRIDYMIERIKRYRVNKITLLPYHSLALGKYNQLHKNFTYYEEPTPFEMNEIVKRIEKEGVEAKYLQS